MYQKGYFGIYIRPVGLWIKLDFGGLGVDQISWCPRDSNSRDMHVNDADIFNGRRGRETQSKRVKKGRITKTI